VSSWPAEKPYNFKEILKTARERPILDPSNPKYIKPKKTAQEKEKEKLKAQTKKSPAVGAKAKGANKKDSGGKKGK